MNTNTQTSVLDGCFIISVVPITFINDFRGVSWIAQGPKGICLSHWMRASRVSRDDVIGSIAGASAGAITAVAVCPLDVLRTRFQVQSRNRKYTGLANGVRTIYREEGLIGLYKGLTPTLIALVPNWAVYFSVYEHLKLCYLPHVSGMHIKLRKENTFEALCDAERRSTAVHLVSAIGAGVSTIVVTNPLWVVKTRLQTQDMGIEKTWRRYRGTLDGLQQIVKHNGISRLYAGLVPALFGIAHVAIQFPLYEYLKQRLSHRPSRSEGPLSVQELIFASSLSKMIASTATYPHEVLRSHMHLNGTKPFTGLRDMIQKIWAEDGIRGFYKGCAVNLCRTVPSAALTFTSYELILRLLQRITQPDHNKMEKLVAS